MKSLTANLWLTGTGVESVPWIGLFSLVIPLLVAIIAWYLNEHSKRRWETYKRKEDSYRKLIESLRGFYEASNDAALRTKFLGEVNVCWLFAPDEVIQRAYEFLDTVHLGNEATATDRERSAGELFRAVREDLISGSVVKSTSLTADSFKHLGVVQARTGED